MGGGQRQQIEVRHLPRTVDVVRREHCGVSERHIVWPELMCGLSGERGQSTNQICWAEPAPLAVAIVRHDAHDAVLRDWTARPSLVVVIRPPLVGSFMEHVVGVEESDDDVHIEQGPHDATRLPRLGAAAPAPLSPGHHAMAAQEHLFVMSDGPALLGPPLRDRGERARTRPGQPSCHRDEPAPLQPGARRLRYPKWCACI